MNYEWKKICSGGEGGNLTEYESFVWQIYHWECEYLNFTESQNAIFDHSNCQIACNLQKNSLSYIMVSFHACASSHLTCAHFISSCVPINPANLPHILNLLQSGVPVPLKLPVGAIHTSGFFSRLAAVQEKYVIFCGISAFMFWPIE